MAETENQSPEQGGSDFEKNAQAGQQGFFRELLDFLRHEKKWWITPTVVLLVLLGLLVALSGTAAAPFIYTLF